MMSGSRTSRRPGCRTLRLEHELLGAQDGEVLGDIGLLHAEPFDERAGGEFAVAQQLEDGDAGGMGEGLEDIGFEPAEGIRHT